MPVNDLGVQWAELSLDSNFGAHQVSRETLHNAVTDVYVLYRVYDHFLHELNQSGSVQELLAALLPESFAPEAVYIPIDLAIISRWSVRCDWSLKPACASPPQAVPEPPTLLNNYLANRGYRPPPVHHT